MENKQYRDLLIRAVNKKWHTQYRYSDDNRMTVESYTDVLIRAFPSKTETQIFYAMRDAIYKGESKPEYFRRAIIEAVNKVRAQYEGEGQPAPAPTPATTTPTPAEERKDTPAMGTTQNNDTIQLLAAVLAQTMNSVGLDSIKAGIEEELNQRVDKYIAKTYGDVPRKIEVTWNGQTHKVEGLVHAKFMSVAKCVAMNEPVLLKGPAGTGKSHLAEQVAKALGLDFYTDTAVTMEHKALGFIDAEGKYHETELYKAYTKGGVYVLDEMDASAPEVMVVINNLMSQWQYAFPNGLQKRHPNFRVVASANTFGLGADSEYVGRAQLDAATLDRFAVIEIDYDPRVEEAMAQGDNELVNFCRAFRKACNKAGIRCIVSYRGIKRMASLGGDDTDTVELLKMSIVKALDKQDIRTIRDSVQGYGKYSAALNKLAEI